MPVPADWTQQQKRILEEYQQSPDRFGRAYDEIFGRLVWTEAALSWDGFLGWLNELQGAWCFRGQREAEWPLQTSFERMARVSHSGPNSSGSYQLRGPEERELLFRFQQQAHHCLRHLPSGDDLANWFALMQHHGAPTRMLDWTRSPYVALYFAIEEKPQGTGANRVGLGIDGKPANEKRSAIWAIDLDWLERSGKESLGSMPDGAQARTEYLNHLLSQKQEPVIVRIDPLQSNERMFAQQGFFLWKVFEETPFFDQILMSMMVHPKIPGSPVIRKLEIGDRLRIEFLKNLRVMNIHRASLFPGLDGFCQSLKRDLEIKVAQESARASELDRALAVHG